MHVRAPSARSSLSASPSAARKSPERTSTTSAYFGCSSRPLASSATLAMSCGGRLTVVGDREAVRFVTDLLEQMDGLAVARDEQRVAEARPVHLLEALREARDRDVFEAEFFEHAHCDVELALAAVDQQQVRWIAEPLALLRALFTFAQVVAE